jgi:hypothetical protein
MDWIVEPMPGEESWAGNRSHLTSAGALLLDVDSLWLSLQPNPEDHWSKESYFDLLANKFTDKHPEFHTVPEMAHLGEQSRLSPNRQ